MHQVAGPLKAPIPEWWTPDESKCNVTILILPVQPIILRKKSRSENRALHRADEDLSAGTPGTRDSCNASGDALRFCVLNLGSVLVAPSRRK